MKNTFYLLSLLCFSACQPENEISGSITGRLLLFGTKEPIGSADVQLLGTSADLSTSSSAYTSYWKGETEYDGSFIIPRSSVADWLYFKSTDDYWDFGLSGSIEVDHNGANSDYYLFGKAKLHIQVCDTSNSGAVAGAYIYPYAPEADFVKLVSLQDVYSVDVLANEQQRVAYQLLYTNGEQSAPLFLYLNNPGFLGSDTLKIKI